LKELMWDTSLSVQIQEIDDDHRKLVELLNILNRSVTDGDAIDYIEAVIDELLSCSIWHFRHEERLMLKHGYEGLLEHKAEHQELIESLTDLQQAVLQKTKILTSEDIEFLEHWLTGHIFGSDMEMASFLGEIM